MTHWVHHPAVRSGNELTRGERAADTAVAGLGSWAFLVVQTVFVTFWVFANVYLVFIRWDPYPFILLNLMFSVQAAYSAPLILLGQRRQDVRNAEISAHTLANTEATNTRLDAIDAKLDQILACSNSAGPGETI